MAIWQHHEHDCACGHAFTARTLDCFNGSSRPDLRNALLNGKLHRRTCPACGRINTIERSFLYIEDDALLILVRPRRERPHWPEDAAHATSLAARYGLSPATKIRVVYGLAELREKLVAHDIGVRDEAVELFKLALVQAQPRLGAIGGLRLILESVTGDQAVFIATTDLRDGPVGSITLPAARLEALSDNWDAHAADPDSMAAEGLRRFAQEKWINLWRWSPQPWALGELHRRVSKRDGVLDQNLVSQLPRSALAEPEWRMPAEALLVRDDTPAPPLPAGDPDRTLELHLEEHYGLQLDDQFAITNPIICDWLQQTLAKVPEMQFDAADAELKEINLAPGDGKASGWYDPGSDDIFMNRKAATDPALFEEVLLHEVGHVVHARFADQVDRWLVETKGWRLFEATGAGIRAWLDEMGGWIALPAGSRQMLVDQVRAAIMRQKDPATGTPGKLASAYFGGAASPAFQAYDNSLGKWWERTANWPGTAAGHRYAFNFQYGRLMRVSQETIDRAVATGKPYALMSDKEFFAELYMLAFRNAESAALLHADDLAFIRGVGVAQPAEASKEQVSA
jgi:hypothetical protein